MGWIAVGSAQTSHDLAQPGRAAAVAYLPLQAKPALFTMRMAAAATPGQVPYSVTDKARAACVEAAGCAVTSPLGAQENDMVSPDFFATVGFHRHGVSTLHTRDFAFDLPEAQIAAFPAPQRDGSRLLVMDRTTGLCKDAQFGDILRYLRPRSVLVLNDTRVIPARLSARKQTGGAVEVLLVRRLDGADADSGENREHRWEEWEVLARGVSAQSRLPVKLDLDGKVQITLTQSLGRGAWRARFSGLDSTGVLGVAARLGRLPLPPYIEAARARVGAPDGGQVVDDDERYQTVYARAPGAVAAPTAGLHFTPELLARLADAGHEIVRLTLHVGPGTFRPVETEDPLAHSMDAEYYEIPAETISAVRCAQKESRPIVAVGTTVVRALESAVRAGFPPGWQETRLFITPGHDFQVVTDLITNFHLPRSTLIMLVCAFAGSERVLAAYRHAVASGYRFYSYGDAMFLSPGVLSDPQP